MEEGEKKLHKCIRRNKGKEKTGKERKRIRVINEDKGENKMEVRGKRREIGGVRGEKVA